MHILEQKGECMSNTLHATTIYAVRHNGEAAMAGDGQVTLDNKLL